MKIYMVSLFHRATINEELLESSERQPNFQVKYTVKMVKSQKQSITV